ncbi:MAG: hypothetical protein WAU58_17345 [Terriglobales bacterium]
MRTCRFQFRFMLCLTLAALAISPVFAQQNPGSNGTPVHMVVTVEPHHGSDVAPVTRDDVMVYEGKERDQVLDWVPAQGDHAGLELFILIDDSSGQSLDSQLSDIKKFIAAQPATAKIGVAYMQNGTARIEQNLTDNHDLAVKAFRLPMGYFGAEASPYFSLSDLAKHWQQDGARHEVLMVSSGSDPYYGTGDMLDPYLAAAIDDSQRAGILVSAIYAPSAGHIGHSRWLSYWGQLYLAKLAEETGGEAYYIGFNGPAVDFTPYLNDLAARFNHQYLLTFAAKPKKKSGLQHVKLRTEVHDVDLVSADAVYVPASE